MTIGTYARAVGLPPTALRHYDDVGLLHPDHVDPHTGYRYYATETVRRARRIRDLREAGIPIETMRRLLDGSPQVAADELRALATREQTASARTATLLRRLAADLDSPRESGAVLVDGPVLADAVRAVAPHTGDRAPFDRVVLAAEPTGLDVVATNTFTLAVHQCVAPSTVSGRVGLPVRHLDAMCNWLEHQSSVTVSMRRMPQLVGESGPAENGLVEAADFPDHFAFIPPATVGEHRALIDRSQCLAELRAADDYVWLSLDDSGAQLGGAIVGHQVVPVDGARRIRFTTDLLRRALDSLPGPRVLIDHTDPLRPCLLTSPVQPGRMVVVMPARHPH